MIRTVTLSGLLLAALIAPAFAQKDGDRKDKQKPKAKVYKTPQEAFDAFVTADQKRDFETLYAVMAPEAQNEAVAMLSILMVGVRAEVERHSASLSSPMAGDIDSDQVSVGVSWRF